MKNSKILIAVVISMAFIVFWDTFVVSRYAPKKATSVVVSTEAKPVIPAEIKPAPVLKPAAPEKTLKEKGLDQATLKIDNAEVVVTNIGGAIAKWKVQEDDGNWVELVQSPVLKTFPEAPSTLVQKSDRIAVFTQHPDGFQISKTLTLLEEAPFHALAISVTNTSNVSKTIEVPLAWTGGLHKHIIGADPKSHDADAVKAEMRVAAFQNRAQSWRPGVIFGRTIDSVFQGPYEWIAADNHHFLAALMMKGGALPAVHVTANRDTPPAYEVPLTFSLAPHETKTQTIHMFVGPKKYDTLKTLGHNLDASVEFGMFGVIAKLLLSSLEFFKGITHNYGWAIVLLTMSIQVLVYPLTKKSLSHAVRMKELQPQIKQIQEQFKNDQKRIQIEMFNLYRKNGMKFMGMEGCFPILLQLPVFFAFYSTLRVAYELRGASWLWIPDLGLHDPFYILPIIMGLGMFVQQKTTTVATDPAQAKMMMFMPVIMTFMFLKLSAGLVLYWSINSICTILIQKFLQWRRHAAPATA